MLIASLAHAQERYCSQFVCHSSAGLVRVCNELNLPARSLLYSEGFELMDFTKKAFFLELAIACFAFGIPKRSGILRLAAITDVGALLIARRNTHALIGSQVQWVQSA